MCGGRGAVVAGHLLERPGERRECRDEKLLEERDGVAHLLSVGVRLRD